MMPTADLLKDCQRLLKELEKDIRARAEVDAALNAQYEKARSDKQTGITFGAWLSEQVTQAAVAWVLATVFVRFLEDNRLIDEAWISGPDDVDLARSRQRAAVLAREAYISEFPEHSDAQYLLHVVRTVGTLPACRDIFAEDRNPLFRLSVSADGAKRILAFWKETDQTGRVIRTLDTTDVADTRWLGDLYQDLSADARKRFALLQTPDFVEEFILDYTLTPAIATFGLEGLRGIDPTCGSGHFLLGMFRRLLHAWEQQLGPGVPVKEAVRRAMGSIYGIDLNPFAVAISRFRLMIAGLHACGYTRMKDCPDFGFTLAVGNTLTLGVAGGFQGNFLAEEGQDHPDYLTPGEYQNAKRVLTQQYHVVVGNPPYIAVKDAAERERIKPRYQSCFKKWPLAVPFTERFFSLAFAAQETAKPSVGPVGFVGLINSNSFTKREFGRVLIQDVLANLDLTHVVDTNGCNIPGHGTPTVILFGRNQKPISTKSIRVVQGIRGEPRPYPPNPADGKVWTALVQNIGIPGSVTQWLSVADVDRKVLAVHPWSLGGGGVGELRILIESTPSRLVKYISNICKEVNLAEDACYLFPEHSANRIKSSFREIASGDSSRDWSIQYEQIVAFPYDDKTLLTKPLAELGDLRKIHWDLRTTLRNRVFFNKTPEQMGKLWHEYPHFERETCGLNRVICYSEISTHNHFALSSDDNKVVFNITAPVIKLAQDASRDDHYAVLSCLNSSTAVFWFKQVCTCKGGPGGGRTFEDAFLNYFAFNSTNIEKTPIPDAAHAERVAVSRRLSAFGQELAALQPRRLFATQAPTRHILDQTVARVTDIRSQMIFWQEELDWLMYRAYGILTEDECPMFGIATVPLALGERAFEIDLARKVAAEEEETSWFERHRSTPITDIPAHWPAAYQQIVQHRLDLIASHPHIGLLEKPEHKRRWQSDPWADVVQRGLRDWLCDQLEDRRLWPAEPALISTTTLADLAFRDATFTQVAALYRGNDHFDQHELIRELVTDEAVPALPIQRYTDEGLIKRADWETTWDLQRREDAGETVAIPVPPRYIAKDFQKATYWSHRGKLDVPKERFISYPGISFGKQADGDAGLLILWAGYDHAQHATALVDWYQATKDTHGREALDRLQPLLASLDQLIPWLKQWHNDLNPTMGVRLGDTYAEFLLGECADLGITAKDLRAWKPTAVSRATSPKRAVSSDGGNAPKTRGRPKKEQA